jgi:hypothetical protein
VDQEIRRMDRNSPGVRFLTARDATYHLPPEDRDRISTWLDADGLEEVIAWMEPECRGEILEAIRLLANTNAAAVRVLPVDESDPEWIAAPDELKSAVKRLSRTPPASTAAFPTNT